ncbi:MAG: phospholipid carrier-dependent glycosyltransferase [Chloroflexi bacterium]|nr:phospholipid carrier-dependent glycosyltransferase [Chloroflexota bacterium]MCL5273871.1 phospholipid carrier-dependent glycosyltransferase [Chloroflexota bacterium]
MIGNLTHSRWRIVILLAFTALGIIYSFATPMLEKNDEESHAWFVRYIANGGGLPIQAPGSPDAPLHREGSQPPLYYALAALVWRQFDTSDFDVEMQPNASPSFNPYGLGNKNLLIITPEKRAFNYRGTTLAALVLRLLGIIPGCITIWFTYAIAYALTRSERAALLAMGLTAFNPMFITVVSAVGNDGPVIAMSTVGLYLLVVMALEGITLKRLIAAGVVMAVASLFKVSGTLLLPVAALAIIGRELLTPDKPAKPLAQRLMAIVWQGSVLAVIWLVLAGWWYARNLYLYNDLTGVSIMAQMMTPRNISLGEALSEFTGFRMSYIAMFGQFALPADDVVYTFFDTVAVMSGIGLLVALDRLIRTPTYSVDTARYEKPAQFRLRLLGGTMLALHAVFLLISIVRWTMMTPASHGRLLFPAIGGISTLMAIGLQQFDLKSAPRRFQATGIVPVIVVLPLALVSVIAPWRYIIPGYTPPLLSSIPADVTPVTQHMGALADLVAFRMSPHDVHPGDTVIVTSVLRARSVPRDNYLLVTKLYGRDNVELARFDTFTGGGLLPSSQWQVGDLWKDEVALKVPLTAQAPTILRAQFDLYNRGSGDLIQSTDEQGKPGSPLFDGSTLLPTVNPAQPQTSAVLAQFGDIGAVTAFTRTEALPGQPMTVTLAWHTLRAADRDYTVFVHFLDAAGQQQSQHDGQPDDGNFITTRWSTGVNFQDAHRLLLPADLPPGQYILVAGMYDPSNGQRLVALGPNHDELRDRVVVLDHITIR